MSRNLANWTFRDVRGFLSENGFELHHIRGSHYFFRKYSSGSIYMVCVQRHGAKTIPSGTMMAIMRQSGINKEDWLKN